MLTDKIKELEAAKAKMQALEQSIIDERPIELASLPSRYGFANVNDFIKAVKEAVVSGGSRRKAGRKAAAPAKPAKAKKEKAEKKARGRARITDEVKANVKSMVEAGKSGNEIAKALGISLPSVQNIKKAFGMVKSRIVASVEAPVAPVAEVVAPAPTA